MSEFVQREAKIDNESLLFVDSNDRLEDTLYNEAHYKNGSGLVKQQISHIGLKSYHVENLIPNINERNNSITFWSDVAASNFTVVLANGNYSVVDMMTLIETALNTVSGPSSVTFTIAAVTLGSSEYIVSGTNLFRFVSSSHIDRAASTSGLFVTTGSTTVMTVVARGLYTRYVDVLISNLKQGQVLENTFSKVGNLNNFSHVQRIVLTGGIVDREIRTIHYTRVRPRNVTDLVINLVDEYGDSLYAPVQNLGGDNYQVDYFKYLFTISLKSVRQ